MTPNSRTLPQALSRWALKRHDLGVYETDNAGGVRCYPNREDARQRARDYRNWAGRWDVVRVRVEISRADLPCRPKATGEGGTRLWKPGE